MVVDVRGLAIAPGSSTGIRVRLCPCSQIDAERKSAQRVTTEVMGAYLE